MRKFKDFYIPRLCSPTIVSTCTVCGNISTAQTFSYENQLELKASQVKKLIDEVCEDYEFEGILGSPVEWGY
ncbi:MAG TPA: hypothetical protein VHQ24_08300, partial [Lachnospiraceae bacterium]|nr:hypothetical protein [Lachnospiraceae bacterium]